MARHMGIEVLGISCVTNLAAGLSADAPEPRRGFRDGAPGGAAAGRPAGAADAEDRGLERGDGSGIVSENEGESAQETTDRGCRFRRWCWGLRAARARARRRWPRSWRTRSAESTFIWTTTIATWGTCPSANGSKQNFDDPAMIESPLLAAHVAALARGEAIERPIYDFATHTRVLGQTERVTRGGVSGCGGSVCALLSGAAAALQSAGVYRHAGCALL